MTAATASVDDSGCPVPSGSHLTCGAYNTPVRVLDGEW